jgi:hypothetical protein
VSPDQVGVTTHRILVGRPIVRRFTPAIVEPHGWYVAIRYANGVVARYSSTQAGAMDLGRAAVRNAMFCRCTDDGPIYMRSLGDPARLRAIHGGERTPTHIELREGRVTVP